MNISRRKNWVLQVFHNADYKYFQKAKQVANISDYQKIHIGCVAVYMGQVVGLGCN